jgi:recombination associated protein RdgC
VPLLRGAVTLSRFRASFEEEKPPADVKRWLGRGLRARAFEPLDRKSEEDRAVGFVELENHEAIDFSPGSVLAGEHPRRSYRVDTLKVPGAALKAELAKWVSNFEKENERPPSRPEKAQGKEAIKSMLRTRATPITKVHDVSISLKSHEIQIWAASRKAVEEIALALEEALSVKLEPLVVAAAAQRAGIDEDELKPTPALVGGDLIAEVTDGQA